VVGKVRLARVAQPRGEFAARMGRFESGAAALVSHVDYQRKAVLRKGRLDVGWVSSVLGRRWQRVLTGDFMPTLLLVFIVAAAIIAIWSAVRPQPILWIAVLLLCIVEALHSLPAGYIR
jgi:hypothetical protein